MVAPYVPYEGAHVTRAEAKAAGLKRFFQGVQCSRGHVAERRINDGTCVRCHAEKSLARYYADPAKHSEVSRRWKATNRDKINSAQTIWRRENKEKLREQRKRLRKINPERQRAVSARDYERNAEKRRAATIAWCRANPEKASALRGNRRARMKQAEGKYTGEDIARIGNAQRWRCHWCAKPVRQKYHVDHIKPLSKGGSNWPSNLAVTCGPCNLRKHDADPASFARRLGLLI